MSSMVPLRAEGESPLGRLADWFEDAEEASVGDELDENAIVGRGWDVRPQLRFAQTLDILTFQGVLDLHVWAPRRTDSEVHSRFAELRDQWEQATMYHSSLHAMVTHPTYQQIIGLGPQVVPVLIDELRHRPVHWYWALAAIVGDDHGVGAATPAEAAEQWIAWYDSRS